MSFFASSPINRGCYEHPHSGVGIEYSPLGGPLSEGQILIHEVGYLEKNDHWIFPNTISPFWRLYYNFDPGHHAEFRTHRIPLSPDHIILIPDHQLFDSRGLGPVRHFWMNFSLDLSLRKGDSVVLPIRTEELQKITSICDQIQSFSAEQRFSILHESASLLHSLFTRPEIPWNEHSRSPHVIKATAHITAHFADSLDVPNLAKISGVSARTLSRMFEQEYRMTVPKFISRVRIREAARMLENTELSIDEIADRTGFPNRYYLTRVFTRIIGKPPAQYRKDCRARNRQSL